MWMQRAVLVLFRICLAKGSPKWEMRPCKAQRWRCFHTSAEWNWKIWSSAWNMFVWKRIRIFLIFLWKVVNFILLEMKEMINRRERSEESRTIFLSCAAAEISSAITQREYNRLLQLPRDRELEGDLLDRAEKARAWYEKHGRPFVAARRVAINDVSGETISLQDETQLHSLVLSQRLKAGEANA